MRVLPRCILSIPFFLALFVWIFNDHILKYEYPGLVTGKLSDFAGLFCFPFVLGFLLNNFFKNLKERDSLYISIFSVALIFSLANLSEDIYYFIKCIFWGKESLVTSDPSDLIALVVIPFMILFYDWIEESANETPSIYAYPFVLVSILTFLNTSPVKRPVTNEMRVLRLLLTINGPYEDEMHYENLNPENKLTGADVPSFRWTFRGYYLGTDPSTGNKPETCAPNQNDGRTNLYKVGGEFVGYKLEIFEKKDVRSEKPLFTFERIMGQSYTLQEPLPKGEYAWAVSLVFENKKSDCPAKEVIFRIPSSLNSETSFLVE